MKNMSCGLTGGRRANGEGLKRNSPLPPLAPVRNHEISGMVLVWTNESDVRTSYCTEPEPNVSVSDLPTIVDLGFAAKALLPAPVGDLFRSRKRICHFCCGS